ncbi:sensor histidine kinase [Aphanothece sacrum]|uniref:Circadian input-output histidine kinase CikA n=1 Tax=Aphanothece sacrum FPU1 TaxID=1920663 RepID=A0A401IDS0_APHSA|nr:GAF domain-containing sensor histidine kinase [Aphanothece sacrum]GBF79330.1 two-component sensor histidine kinase CikA [Aphanothece sacrum FPU1]GBF86832.1 Circadian input kinase A [Aphanothece sacrum FPU3]
MKQVVDSWPQGLFSQIKHIVNSFLDPQEKIVPILSILGQCFQVDQVILLEEKEVNSEIYQKWPIKEINVNPLKQIFPCQNWTNLSHCSCDRQVYQFCLSNHLIPYSKKQELIESFDRKIIVTVPVFRKGEFFGHLILADKESSKIFTPEEIQILEIITDQISLILYQIELQEKVNQLEVENQQLKSACQNKSDYLSHMNHELRTPLTGILGFSKMLKEELYGPLNEKQKQYANGIAVSGQHLLALVNDFLDLSKIEADREEIFVETVAVEDLCLSAFSMVEAKAKEQNLDLILELGETIDFCTVDQRRIKQILLNLLSNAIKFTEKGSVTLAVQRHIEKITFSVIDTGIGIKEADQNKLFQPFQQIQNSLSRKHKGTGLGLTLSRKLAQLHGGDITLTSEEGKGSCFTLHLPI